jgi:hypothetical protein
MLVGPSGRFSNFPDCVAPWRAQGECLIAGAMNIGTTSLPHPALVLQRRTRCDPNASMVRRLLTLVVCSDELYNDTSASTFI